MYTGGWTNQAQRDLFEENYEFYLRHKADGTLGDFWALIWGKFFAIYKSPTDEKPDTPHPAVPADQPKDGEAVPADQPEAGEQSVPPA